MSPPPEQDATRRTHLANERTYLAWWRTGLGCLAAAVGAGRVVPALTKGTRWPYAVVGAGFAVLGIACLAYAYIRHGEVQRAVERGDFVRPDGRVLAALAGVGVLLGLIVLTIVMVD